MTRTATHAISMENHTKKDLSHMRAVRVKVIGLEKHVRPY